MELQEQQTKALSSEQKNIVFENMSDGVVTINGEGRITYVNSAFADLFGYSAAELLNQPFDALFLSNKKNKAFNRFFRDCFKKNCSAKKELVKYQTQKDTLFFHINASLLHTAPKQSSDAFPGMMILLEDMTDACRLKQHEHDCAYTFAGLVFCISGYLSIWSLTKFTLKLPLKTDDYTMMIEGISFLLFLEILLFTSLSLRDIGLIPKRGMFQKSLKETLLLAAGACLDLLSAKVILTLCGAPIKEKFIGGSIAGMTNYMITATVQEFLARGVIQTCIKSLMQVRYQKTFGVILTSLLFSIMHLPFGFIFMMGSLLLSLVLGYIFERHQHMWGCAFLHWSCGYLAMCLFF